MSFIDFRTPNQIILWNNSVVITSGRTHEYHFVGNAIVAPHDYQQYSWFKNKNEPWSIKDKNKKLLPTLPPIINFYIHNDELY